MAGNPQVGAGALEDLGLDNAEEWPLWDPQQDDEKAESIVDVALPVGATRAALCFHSVGSNFLREWYEQNGITGFTVQDWQATDPRPGSKPADEDDTKLIFRRRRLKYKVAEGYNTEEIVRCTVCAWDERFEMQQCIQTFAPYGDRIRVLLKETIEATGSESCRLEVRYTIRYVKGVNGMIKSIIASNVTKGLKKSSAIKSKLIASYIEVPGAVAGQFDQIAGPSEVTVPDEQPPVSLTDVVVCVGSAAGALALLCALLFVDAETSARRVWDARVCDAFAGLGGCDVAATSVLRRIETWVGWLFMLPIRLTLVYPTQLVVAIVYGLFYTIWTLLTAPWRLFDLPDSLQELFWPAALVLWAQFIAVPLFPTAVSTLAEICGVDEADLPEWLPVASATDALGSRVDDTAPPDTEPAAEDGDPGFTAVTAQSMPPLGQSDVGEEPGPSAPDDPAQRSAAASRPRSVTEWASGGATAAARLAQTLLLAARGAQGSAPLPRTGRGIRARHQRPRRYRHVSSSGGGGMQLELTPMKSEAPNDDSRHAREDSETGRPAGSTEAWQVDGNGGEYLQGFKSAPPGAPGRPKTPTEPAEAWPGGHPLASPPKEDPPRSVHQAQPAESPATRSPAHSGHSYEEPTSPAAAMLGRKGITSSHHGGVAKPARSTSGPRLRTCDPGVIQEELQQADEAFPGFDVQAASLSPTGIGSPSKSQAEQNADLEAMIVRGRIAQQQAKSAATVLMNREVSPGVVEVQMFENERAQPFRGFGHTWPGHMLPSDRGHWSLGSGKDCGTNSQERAIVEPQLPAGWAWLGPWCVDLLPRPWEGVDEEGWSYALDFPWVGWPPRRSKGKPGRIDFVRVRRWVRVRVLEGFQVPPGLQEQHSQHLRIDMCDCRFCVPPPEGEEDGRAGGSGAASSFDRSGGASPEQRPLSGGVSMRDRLRARVLDVWNGQAGSPAGSGS
ncbi:unnamed protein product [Pedinophyceae sp. YPF-701]|nr:unnamed protein product [Pedinophyceae sp. YPF-701]